MTSLFLALPQDIQMVLLIVGAVFGGLALIQAIKAGLRVTFGRNSLSIGQGTVKAGPFSPHVGCKNAKDVLLIINKVVTITTRKLELTHFKTLQYQKSYAEERANQLVGRMQRTYLGLLHDKGMTDAVNSASFQSYRFLLSALKTEMLNVVDIALREDRLEYMKDVVFHDYLDLKVDTLLGFATEFLNESYFYTVDLPRGVVYAANLENIHEYRDILSEVFRRARSIGLEDKDELEVLDKVLEETLLSVTGY